MTKNQNIFKREPTPQSISTLQVHNLHNNVCVPKNISITAKPKILTF